MSLLTSMQVSCPARRQRAGESDWGAVRFRPAPPFSRGVRRAVAPPRLDLGGFGPGARLAQALPEPLQLFGLKLPPAADPVGELALAHADLAGQEPLRAPALKAGEADFIAEGGGVVVHAPRIAERAHVEETTGKLFFCPPQGDARRTGPHSRQRLLPSGVGLRHKLCRRRR